MKKFALMLVLVFVQAAIAADPPAYCVPIIVVTKEGANCSGSGTIVAEQGKRRLVLTNCHVLDKADKVYVIRDGKLIAGEKPAVAKSLDDLGAFEVEIDLPLAKLAKKDAAAGDEISHFGTTSHKTSGSVVHFLEIQEPGKRQVRVMSCNKLLSVPGDSGAGVFNVDEELVAVNFGAVLPIESTVALAVPVTAVKSFLKDYKGWTFKP